MSRSLTESVNLLELAGQHPDVNLVIKAGDLDNAARKLLQQFRDTCKDELRDEIGTEFMTREETAKFMKVTFATLWRWANKGYLCPVKVGRTVKYRRRDVLDVMKLQNNRMI